MGRQKGAAPDYRGQIRMDYGTPDGLRETMELRSIWVMRSQKRATPDDRAQIYMDSGTPKGAAPDDRV